MQYTQLAAREAVIYRTSFNSTFAPTSFGAKGGSHDLNKVSATSPLRLSSYQTTEPAKERIVLHFTAGPFSDDPELLAKRDYPVSMPFVIARDGTIFQLYLSRFRSDNAGADEVGNTGANVAQDKRTIGVELSNYSPLYEKNGVLYTVDDIPYCTLNDKAAYLKLNTAYREETYYATFTDAQYHSLARLLCSLTSQYQIPRTFVPEPTRYKTFEGVTGFKGIVSHVNYRPIGQADIGPAFDWNRLIHDVQAPVFGSGEA